MKTNHFSFGLSLKSEIKIFFFILLTLPTLLLAQEKATILEAEALRPDSTVGGKKSTMAAYGSVSCWNGSYYSDYYIYFQWSGYNFQCDCSNSQYYVKLTINGVDYFPGWFAGASYSGYGCKVGLGPGQSGTCGNVNTEGGGHNYFLFGCLTGCGANWHSSSDRYFWTDQIKSPVSPVASQAKWDYRIDLSWDKTTDIPDAEHGYLIKRDGVEIAKVFNGQRTYSDVSLGPNQSHTYTIHTIWPDNDSYTKISYGVSVTGTTFDLNLNASVDQPAAINLTWNSLKNIQGKNASSLSYYKIDRYDEANNKTTTIPVQIDNSTNNYPDESSSLLPGYLYKYTLRPFPEDGFYPDTAWGKLLPNGRIKGKVLSPTGQGVKNIKVCAIRLDSLPQDTTTTYCALTDTAGTFEIRNIYYYLQSRFRVVPSREDHGFDPVYEEPTLYKDAPWLDGIVFTDTSAFTVEGRIVQQGNRGLCPLRNVPIYVNDKETRETVTDADGIYRFSVGQIDNYTVRPMLDGHGFIPKQMKYLVTSDTILADFLDTTMFKLSGYVNASCNMFIGTARLGITSGSTENIYYDTVIMTEPVTGYYEIRLPAREYEVSILEFFSTNPDVENEDVETYFPSMNADLTFGDRNLDFIYRSEPELLISGFPEYGCGEYDGIPIIGQGYKYTLNFEVREVFGENNCLADTGYVIIQNHAGNESEKTDTVWIAGGTGNYSFIPGEPNLFAPNLKNLTFIAAIGSESTTKSVDVLVLGNRPREQTFTTVSPEIPFMILRDPPGDASYSYIEEGTATETALRLSALVSGSLKTWAEVKAGMKFEAGFGVTVETEIWGKLRGSLEVGASISNQNEFTLSISNGERFSTSGNPDITGESGDIFAGSALNLIYALTDVISYDAASCMVNKSVALSMGVTGFATTFIYTDSHIRNVLIPQLTYLRNYYSLNDNDSAKIYGDQIDVWQQTLKLNADLKMQSKFIENRSFSSGASYEAFQEVATKISTALAFSIYIEANIAAEAGIEVGGVGVSGGVEVKVRTEFGAGATFSATQTRKTGYVLNDNDGNDYFSVDILGDQVYATPVFKTVSGASSCPWEEGTQAREGVQLTSDIYTAEVDDPNGTAVFHLVLGNTSQSDEDMVYDLVFDQGSNPDGAVITLGGSQVQGGVPEPYYVVAGSTKEATVTVRRGPDAFDYENLMFKLVSRCDDPAIADSVFLDVHFKSPCSNVRLSLPKDNWSISSLNNSRLKVKVDNYERDKLDFIKLQLAPAGTNNWQTVSYLDKDNLNSSATETTLLLDQFNDGVYDVRALLECNAGRQYSGKATGVIDRQAPELYGLPEPSDLVLDSADMIVAVFNEDINCYKVAASQLEFRNLTKNKTINAEIGCSEDMVIIIPDLSGGSFEGDTFNVKLSGLEDLYGNVISDPISWSFIIKADPTPPEDTDLDIDAIQNGTDNCPWSFNPAQEDMDIDGKGDVCDDDLDGDGVLNSADNCMKTSNPDQKDENDDNVGDVCQDNTGIIKPGSIEGFRFYANHPNPFSESTILSYTVPVECYINMRIFDVIGKEVAVLVNGIITPGTWEVTWDAVNNKEGVYYCTIYAEERYSKNLVMKTIKMAKIK
jgi:hypothetical protein